MKFAFWNLIDKMLLQLHLVEYLLSCEIIFI